MLRLFATLITGILLAVLAGCGLPPPERTYVEQQPKTTPVRNITSFTPALQCMDELFQVQEKKFMITSAGIPDETGQMKAGTKEMLISTIAKMSTKSNAFTFVDFDLDKRDVLVAQQLIGIQPGFEVPRYYVRGAVTQVDKGIMTDRIGGGIGFSLGGGSSSNSSDGRSGSSSNTTKGTLGYSTDAGTSVITIDVNMGDLVTRKIIPNVSTSNSITVTRRGTGFDADATIQKFGVSFEFAMDRSEGSHQALRTLVELSLIEVLGKFSGVPYWNCLQIKQTDPSMLVTARDQYEKIGPNQEQGDKGPWLQTVVAGLVAGGYLNQGSDIQSTDDPRLKQAISKYQADNDLVATGRWGFELYYSLLSKGLIQPEGAGSTVAGGVKPASKSAASRDTISVYLNTSRGTSPTYRVGERLDLTAQVSNDGYLYCYYSDETSKIARVYPNRYAPNPYLNAGQRIGIPSSNAEFSIEFTDASTHQEMLCLASTQELGVKLPANFKVADLEPIGVSSLEDVIKTFQALDQQSLSYQRMRLSVIR